MKLSYLKNGETLVAGSFPLQRVQGMHRGLPARGLRDGRGKARIVDRGACMECGACARNCASGAITVTAGVGCAAAIIGGMLRGTEPSCGCGGSSRASASCAPAAGTTGCC